MGIVTLMGAGGHIVASSSLYGGSTNMFQYTLPRFGITATLVDPRDHEAIQAAIRPETRLVFGEVLGNPGLEVFDIEPIAEIAHDAGLPLMLDATFATPYLCRAFDYGADIVMHSATKWLGGHGVAIGGVLVDSGKFDWAASGKFPTLTEPYDGYHGINFCEEYGPAAFIMRARLEGMRDFGPCMSPTSAFHILQGVETLPMRMERHVANAVKMAAFLAAHDAVAWANHPSLPNHPDTALTKKYFAKGAGSIVCFGVKGGRKAGEKTIERVELFSHLANVGDAKSLILHPASTTHQQLTAAQLDKAGIGEDMIRLSIGLEDADDLMADLGQALRASQRG